MAMHVGGGRRGDPIAAINVTPMADVMIVLLIIFMVATPIIAGAPVQLPAARHASKAPEERRTIVVRVDGSVTLDGAPAPRDAVAGLLAGKAGPVWISGDAGASYDHVQEVLDACRESGADEIGLEVMPEPR
jgi:biopolymer transport protein TolR